MEERTVLFHFQNAFGQSVGPMTHTMLKDMVEAGLLDALTPVCRQGGKQWVPLASLSNFCAVQFGSRQESREPKKAADFWWNWSGPILGFISVTLASMPLVAIPLAVAALIFSALSMQDWKGPGMGVAGTILPILGLLMPLVIALALNSNQVPEAGKPRELAFLAEKSRTTDPSPGVRSLEVTPAEAVRNVGDFVGTWKYAETVVVPKMVTDGPSLQMQFDARLELNQGGTFVWVFQSGARVPGMRFPQVNEARTEGNWSMQPDGSVVAISSDSSGDLGSVFRMIDQDTLVTKLGSADKFYKRVP